MTEQAPKTATSTTLEAALDYHRRGWVPIPLCCPLKKGCIQHGSDCQKPGKTPVIKWAEFQTRRPTEGEVKGWWAKWPEAGVGIVMGVISHLAVLDIDPRNGGNESLDNLVAKGHKLPNTSIVRTGGGGSHFYFWTASEVTTRPALYPGIDLKGEGGYVVAPPSKHPSGGLYEWVVPPGAGELVPLPEWLSQEATATRPPVTSPLPSIIPEGVRNGTLFKLACAIRGKGLSEAGILAALRMENEGRCQPPLSEEEVEAIAQSASRYAPGDQPPNGQKLPPLPFARSLWAELTNGHLPPTPWLVEGLLPEANSLIVGGFTAFGKSWLLLSLAGAIGSGRPWLEKFPTQQVPVLYIDEENSLFELRRRLHRLTKGYGFDAESLPVFFSTGTGLRLSDPQAVGQLEATIKAEGFKLVMVDTLIRVLGYDENDATRVAQGFARIKDLEARLGVAFVFADHHRKPGNFDPGPEFSLRGSTDKSNFVDSILTIRRSRASGQLHILHTKARFGTPMPTFGFSIEDIGEGTILNYQAVAEEEERATLIAEAKETIMGQFLPPLPPDIILSRQDILKSLEGEMSEKWGDRALQELVAVGKLAKDWQGRQGKRGRERVYKLPPPLEGKL